MWKVHIGFIAVIGGLVAAAYVIRSGGKKGNSTSTFVPELGVAQNSAITEAAYHQGPREQAPAAGAEENQGSQEVLNLQ